MFEKDVMEPEENHYLSSTSMKEKTQPLTKVIIEQPSLKTLILNHFKDVPEFKDYMENPYKINSWIAQLKRIVEESE